MSCFEYLRHLAKRLREIARGCFDLETAGHLRHLSDDADRKANELREKGVD